MKMINYALIILVTISYVPMLGQSYDTWNSVWNSDSTLIGYKDNYGVVRIEPKFSGLTSAAKFDNIIAVSEEIHGKWQNYYLTKSGLLVGRDSLYYFDNSFDCECDGFIRFRDHNKDLAGMFNKHGEIAIPAEYNDLKNVRNGMIMALKGAEKIYLEGGEHYRWIGGQEVLIDTLNNTLVENFPVSHSINFYSLERTKSPHSDSTRVSFLASDGTYYSFVDFEKEFSQWIRNELLSDLTVDRLLEISYDTITWESQNAWAKTSKDKLIRNNFNILKGAMLDILDPKSEFSISIDGLNQFMFNDAEFDKYFNNCGESKDWIYPTLSIIISHNVKNDLVQDYFEFLRTDDGFKLISITLRSKNLK